MSTTIHQGSWILSNVRHVPSKTGGSNIRVTIAQLVACELGRRQPLIEFYPNHQA